MTTRDHARRAAIDRPTVCMQIPDWTKELLFALVAALFIAVLFTFGELRQSEARAVAALADADMWREIALTPDAEPTVRVERDGVGFSCSQFNVRREWQAAVDGECRRMGALLLQSRAAP